MDYDTIATTLSGPPVLAVDPEGRPHVAYVDADASSRPNVFHTRHAGAWTPPVNLSLVTTGVPANLPSALDPSIDMANGYLHVLFKDDSLTGDASPTTDRYRYVRNTGAGNFTTFNAPVTVIQRAARSAARPGSLAAYGRQVFVVGGFNVLNEYGWRNESADDGASWSQGATGAIFEGSILAYTYVVGLNPSAPDHRLATMRADGAQEVYRYGWDGASWGSRVTTATESGSTPPNTGAHISIEKHKPPSTDDIVYCWYNGSSGVDRLYCSLETQAMGQGAPTYFRSIGTAAGYQDVGTITVTLGSATVTGSGTTWKTANRGRGDRLTVGANSYVIARVDSNTELTLTAPAVAGATTGTYTIARQFTTLQAWEDCISYTTPCAYFPVGSANLVADDRREIGVAYEDSVFLHSTGGTGGGSPILAIDGTVTGPDHSIALTADGVNRHYGLAGAGVVLDNETNASSGAIFVFDDHVTVEWLEIRNGGGTADGIVLGSPLTSDSFFRLHFNLIHDVPGDGVEVFQSPLANLTMTHSVVAFTGGYSVVLDPLPLGWSPGSQIRLVNNTFYQSSTDGVRGTASSPNVHLANNISHGHVGTDYVFPDLGGPAGPDIDPASRNNLASDTSGIPHSPAGGGWDGISFGQIAFNDTTLRDFHLKVGSFGIDKGADESASATPFDIDAQKRPAGAAWDVGADEVGGTTAVRLVSFAAVPGDGSVTLEWATGSEVDNLGFHVWRGPTVEGPWTRVTTAIVPGAGTSVLGHRYSWTDAGLANGVAYFYRLEDVDTTSKSTFHGPVSAVPGGAAPPAEGGGGESGGGSSGGSGPGSGSGPGGAAVSCPSWVVAAFGSPLPAGASCTRHGDPDAVSYEVLSRDARGATLELRTGGFWALRLPPGTGETAGTVRVYVPGLDTPSESTAPALPLRRALVEATVGRKVRLVSAEPFDLFGFPGMRPSAVGRPEAAVFSDGTVRPARRAVAAPRLSRGYLPQFSARLDPSVFQGETKSAVVEIFPVRFDGYRQQLVLARRVRVRLAFTGTDASETGSGSTGRVLPRKAPFRETLAHLFTTRRGLHAVAFEDLFPVRQRGLATSVVRLQRQGQPIAFRVEPPTATFGPGSVLYFFADRTASSTDFSPEVAWELVRGTGSSLGVVLASPEGAPSTASTAFASFEANKFYMPDLLDAPDPWLWQAAIASPGSPVTAAPLAFTLSGVDAASPLGARLVVHLQGGSESGYTTDHHLEVRLNGVPAGEAFFSGKRPFRFDVALPAASFLEGANTLTLVNLADTGVTSRVFLDRFSVSHPQAPALRAGVLEGTWGEPGIAEVATTGASPIVLDTTLAAVDVIPRSSGSPGDEGSADVSGTSPVKWLLGVESTGSSVRFRTEAGHRYFVVSTEGLLHPRVSRPAPSALRDTQNQADFILVAPRDFMDAAQPLLDRRQGQGLTTAAVAFEEITETFGHGQPSPEAIRDFLSFAFHSWARPAPRYVLLLGDATFDPQRFQAASWASPLPALWTKTSYLTTASDPALAAVNGTDLLPDLAIGRLPAQTPAEAETLVAKILAWEDSGQSLDGKAVLVADNPDEAGDFEQDVEDIRASFLASRPTQVLKLRELGASTRPAVKDAFDQGASLMSYVGHGGAAVWASENVWNSWDVPSLLAQSRQPLLLTLNCLNGYFVANNHDALAEALLKAPGRGTIAAVSPSGLSLDGPAHLYHRALVAEVTSGRHQRLGDALLAAQKSYAQTGFMPELLAIYHLLGDPTTRLR